MPPSDWTFLRPFRMAPWGGILLRRALACTLLTVLIALPSVAFAAPPPQEIPADSLEEAAAAVVRIEAVGTFVDPYDGTQQNVPGFGSGFLIDPTGLAVTNNHVVTGGALFRVYVPGRERPVNARIVGVSECADLAVIDLAGEGYPFLSWAQTRPALGDPIYAAGYPLGYPDYVLTEGEVLERNAWGESDWASLETVIAHNARIRPGNSGGPLLDGSGAVLGVNYARLTSSLRNRSYTIPTPAALDLLDSLIAGDDVHSLGINGVALDEDGRTGIWVASVATGSTADRAGVLPGDLIYEIEGVQVGSGATMEDYCDIVRSHDADDVMTLKLYREVDDAVFAGQLNGRALAEVRDERYPPVRRATSLEYTTHGDAAQVIRFEAPAHWGEVDERDWVYEGRVVGRQIIVAPDLDGFFGDWSVAGIAVSWSFTLANETPVDALTQKPDFSAACDNTDRFSDSDDGFAFDARFYVGCDRGTAAVVAALADSYGDYVVKIEFYATTEEEFDAYSAFYESLDIDEDAAVRAAASTYRTATDATGRISLSVPSLWVDEGSRPLTGDSGLVLGRIFDVSTDVTEFNEYWGVPGISLWLFEELNLSSWEIVDWLNDREDLEVCDDYEGRFDVENERLSGKYDLWSSCFLDGEGYFASVLVVTSRGDTVAVDLSIPNDAYLLSLEPMLQSLVVLPAGSPSFAPSASEAAPAEVSVLADKLNVRRGPGTQYEVVAQLSKGEQTSVNGQSNNCAWLQVPLEGGGTGWISGDPRYVQFSGACADIPERSALKP